MISDEGVVSQALGATVTERDIDETIAETHRFAVLRRFVKHRMALASLLLILLFAVIGILGTAITPYNPYAQDWTPMLHPSPAHWLGTDDLGRDEFSRILLGARISLGISVGAAAFATLIGLIIGMIAGFAGGVVDNLLMRLVDLVLAFPALFLILIIAASTGVNVLTIMALIGAFSWMGLARVVRAEFLRLRELDYVQAARALAVPRSRIIWRHLLPNSIGPVVVSATFIMAGALYAEAALDFLGFGLSPDIPSWGNLLNAAQQDFYTGPLLAIVPGVLLTLAILALNFVGDGLRDAFDPRHSR
jgi:peptide/nickel transport system permease protein